MLSSLAIKLCLLPTGEDRLRQKGKPKARAGGGKRKSHLHLVQRGSLQLTELVMCSTGLVLGQMIAKAPKGNMEYLTGTPKWEMSSFFKKVKKVAKKAVMVRKGKTATERKESFPPRLPQQSRLQNPQ